MTHIDSLLRRSADDITPSRGFVSSVLKNIAAIEERKTMYRLLLSSVSLSIVVLVFCYVSSLLLVEVMHGTTGELLAGIFEEPSLFFVRESWLALAESPFVLLSFSFIGILVLLLVVLRKMMHYFPSPSLLFHALS